MSSFWNSFEIYNKDKHAKFGGYGHGNVRPGQSNLYYSQEYRGPAKELDNSDDQVAMLEGTTVDVSNMSQAELKKLVDGMRKGEPNNMVNF